MTGNSLIISQLDSIHWFLLSYRYFGSVNYTKGWCPGSKAANFSQNGSYATVPNINITTCDFTIAFWVKYIGVDGDSNPGSKGDRNSLD